MEDGEVNKNELMEERYLSGKPHIDNRKEEEIWNLKSQILWLKLGDKITTFFHKQTKSILQKNTMNEIYLGDGRHLINFVVIKEVA